MHQNLSQPLNILIRSSIALLFGLLSCEETYVPKEKAYPRIDLPEHSYELFDINHPYRFEKSNAAIIRDDTFNLFEPHWIHIIYPDYKAKIDVTYKRIDQDKKVIDELVGDGFKLAHKHNVKADAIQRTPYLTQNGKTSMLIRLEGDVPSHFQFMITDTNRHYLRGALYFPIAGYTDSLQPVIDYVQEDILHLLDTFEWKEED